MSKGLTPLNQILKQHKEIDSLPRFVPSLTLTLIMYHLQANSGGLLTFAYSLEKIVPFRVYYAGKFFFFFEISQLSSTSDDLPQHIAFGSLEHSLRCLQ